MTVDSAKLMDMVLGDAPAHEIADAIKDVLSAKSYERIDAMKPVVASSMFDNDEPQETNELEDENDSTN